MSEPTEPTSEITTPPDPPYRTNPPFVLDGEVAMLTSWLDFHRATLRFKCEGLTGEQLATRSAEPSTLSLLGLLRHLTEVERSWFQRVIAGRDAPPQYYDDAEPDGDFDRLDPAQADDALAAWLAEVEASRAVAAEHPSMDALSIGLRHGERVQLRWIMIHMIEEYARHNGHADLLRQRVDGVVGE